MTDHAVGRTFSDEEVIERAIDFIEESGFALKPWQAEALRAILLDPVRSRFSVSQSHSATMVKQADTPMSHAIVADINRFQSRTQCTCTIESYDSTCPAHGASI